MKTDLVMAVKSVASKPSYVSFFSRIFHPIMQRNRVRKNFRVSELAPVRFLFPKGTIEVAYITKKEYLDNQLQQRKHPAKPMGQSVVYPTLPVLKDVIKENGLPKQVFVFQPAVVEIKPGDHQDAVGIFGDAGRFARAAGLTSKEALNFIGDVMALGEEAKLEDPDLWVDLIEVGREGALTNLIRENFGIPENALEGADPKDLLNAIATIQLLGGDPSNEDLWEDVIGQGLGGAYSGLVRDMFGIPGSAMPGASAEDILGAVQEMQKFDGDPTDPQVYKDLSSMTPEDLVKKYLGVDPGSGGDLPGGGSSDSPPSSEGGGSSTGDITSGSGGTHGGGDDIIDIPGSTSSGSSSPSPAGGTEGGGSSSTGTGSGGSSGGGYGPSPGLVLTPGQLQSAIDTAASGSDSEPGSSLITVEVDPMTGEITYPSEETDDETETSGEKDDDETEDDKTDEGEGEEDESSDKSDEDSETEDEPEGGEEPPEDDTEGIPDPEKDTRPGKTWAQMSPEKQQAILLAVQALKNTLINPGDPETPTASTTRTNMNTSWRQLLGPYIYPTEESSSGSSGPTAPTAPGAAVFGPGRILGTLPDPPKPV